MAVAPFAGAWIEILTTWTDYTQTLVAPFAGAWIEIIQHLQCVCRVKSRSLRGSVD